MLHVARFFKFKLRLFVYNATAAPCCFSRRFAQVQLLWGGSTIDTPGDGWYITTCHQQQDWDAICVGRGNRCQSVDQPENKAIGMQQAHCIGICPHHRRAQSNVVWIRHELESACVLDIRCKSSKPKLLQAQVGFRFAAWRGHQDTLSRLQTYCTRNDVMLMQCHPALLTNSHSTVHLRFCLDTSPSALGPHTGSAMFALSRWRRQRFHRHRYSH